MGRDIIQATGLRPVAVVHEDPAVRGRIARLLQEIGIATIAVAEVGAVAALAGLGGLVVSTAAVAGNPRRVLAVVTSVGYTPPALLLAWRWQVAETVTALKNGFSDALAEPLREQETIDAVQALLRIDVQRRHAWRAERARQERLNRLTPRQREVLQAVARGETNAAIARRLAISCKTVEAHRAEAIRRVEARCPADLVRLFAGTAEPETTILRGGSARYVSRNVTGVATG